MARTQSTDIKEVLNLRPHKQVTSKTKQNENKRNESHKNKLNANNTWFQTHDIAIKRN